MAHGASLIFRALIVKCRQTGHIAVCGWRVALQAQEIHLADPQQARIRRPVGSVAAGASLLPNRHVFKSKWSCGFGVAPGADRELSGCRSKLVSDEGAVGVVAITALNQADIHSMAIGPCEFRFLCRVASVAKECLRALE